MTPAARLVLKWLPVGLALAALLGVVGVKLYQRMQRTPIGGYRTPPPVTILDGKPADPSDPVAAQFHKLGLALSLRDAAASERVAEEISRRGDDMAPPLARLLVWQDPVPTRELLSRVVKYFTPRPLAMAVISEIGRAQWLGIGPEPRRARVQAAKEMLLMAKDHEPAIDLPALVGSRFDSAQRIDGRYGLALLAVYLKSEGWERLARGVLSTLQDQEARDEILQAVADAFGRPKADSMR